MQKRVDWLKTVKPLIKKYYASIMNNSFSYGSRNLSGWHLAHIGVQTLRLNLPVHL
jgi:hypothetical protein